MREKERNNKGQVYLIAAVIIVAVIIGFAAVSNYSRSEASTKIYDLGEDLGIESAKVLDYGTYYFSDDPTKMETLLENFIEAYSEYGEIDKLYFIFGNVKGITVYGYHQIASPDIIVNVTGGGEINETTFAIPTDVTGSKDLSLTGDIEKVTIQIAEGTYEFDLEPGENFYFIIVITDDEERYVFVGGD